MYLNGSQKTIPRPTTNSSIFNNPALKEKMRGILGGGARGRAEWSEASGILLSELAPDPSVRNDTKLPRSRSACPFVALAKSGALILRLEKGSYLVV